MLEPPTRDLTGSRRRRPPGTRTGLSRVTIGPECGAGGEPMAGLSSTHYGLMPMIRMPDSDRIKGSIRPVVMRSLRFDPLPNPV